MVDNYSVQSRHLDHCQRGRNCVVGRDDVGVSPPSRFSIPGESHQYGKATVMDKEKVGDIMWSWTQHERSAARKGDVQFYERINKDAVVHGSVGNAQELAAFRKERCSPSSPEQRPSKSRPPGTRPTAGIQSRPHSPFTEVIANRPSGEMETETAARYAEYGKQGDKRREPLRFKTTRSAQLKARERPTQTNKHSGAWTMSKFKNVPSHFEQERLALLGKGATAPNLTDSHGPLRQKAPAEANTSSASGTPHLEWPRQAAMPEMTAANHAGAGSALLSDLASELPSELYSDLQSKASSVSGTVISGIERMSSTVAPSACPAVGPARSQSDKNGQQISIVGLRTSQSSMAIPFPPDTSLCSSSFVGHSLPHSKATARKSRAASAPARRSEAAASATEASAPRRPNTAHQRAKCVNVPERKVASGNRRPASSNPQGRLERSMSAAADAVVISAAPAMVSELNVSFVSDLWARHRPNMCGKQVVESLRRRPHSASA